MPDAVAVAGRPSLSDRRLLVSMFVGDPMVPVAAIAVGLISTFLDAATLGAPHPASLGRSVAVPPLGVLGALSSEWTVIAAKLVLYSCFLLLLGTRLVRAGLIPKPSRSIPIRGVTTFALLAVGVGAGFIVATASTVYLSSLRQEDPGVMPLLMLVAVPMFIFGLCITLGQMIVRAGAGLRLWPRFDGALVGRTLLSAMLWFFSMRILRDSSQDPGAYLLAFVITIVQSAIVAGLALSAARTDERLKVPLVST